MSPVQKLSTARLRLHLAASLRTIFSLRSNGDQRRPSISLLLPLATIRHRLPATGERALFPSSRVRANLE